MKDKAGFQVEQDEGLDRHFTPPSWYLTASLAACGPALLAYSVSPSATFLNQAASVVGWSVFLSVVLKGRTTGSPTSDDNPGRACWTLPIAVFLLVLASLASAAFGSLPRSLALSSVLLLLAALGTGLAGMVVAAAGERVAAFKALAIAMVGAGVLGAAIGAVQVFAPDWADGRWVAASALEGRATGNLRQPNHLGGLLVWAIVAMIALSEIQPRLRQPAGLSPTVPGLPIPALVRVRTTLAQWALMTCLITGVVLSASRTSALALLLLASWGLLDRRLSQPSRMLLWTAPVLYALVWASLTAWADATGHAFGGAVRFSVQGDVSSSRFGIWSNALSLIARQPWLGVGWGEFNFAWSLTPFPDRPTAFFDHTHNLALQWAVELGLPLAGLVLALLGWALWRASATAYRAAPGPQSVVLRSGWMLLLLVLLHSQLEYPLWYAYFLLPTVFVWGLCLMDDRPRGAITDGPARRVHRGRSIRLLSVLRVGAVLMGMVGAGAVLDYWRVVVIFSPPVGARPLDERIEAGQHSLLFAHHAYYAQATTSAPAGESAAQAFRVATHHLLDTRLMIAWAKALNAQGDVERARHLAARLREFRNPNSDAFFEPCEAPSPPSAGEPLPFQCTPPTRRMDWRDFR